jgi:hypothetical protein
MADISPEALTQRTNTEEVKERTPVTTVPGAELPMLRTKDMKHSWSPTGKTRGNQWQIAQRQNVRKQAKSFASRRDQLPESSNGKEWTFRNRPSKPAKPVWPIGG